jgi:disease resistance protein RPM1
MALLRILDLEGCENINNHSIEGIAGLTNLRYLSIRDTPITKLPDKIYQLRLLEFLDIRRTEVQNLPMGMGRLKKLAYLHCDKMRLQEWIGKMVALSWLSQFDIFQSKLLAVEELGNLSKLRKLVLWWFPDLESNHTRRYKYFATSLYSLRSLQSLGIHGGDSSVDILDHLHHPLQQLHRVQLNRSCYLNRIPEWFRSLPSLAYLCIDVKEVKNEDLKLLSELTALIHLSLSSKAMPTERLVISSKGFSVLRDFHLFSARADLTFEPEAIQKVEKLLLSLHVLPGEAYGFSINIGQFLCLKKIDISINGMGAATAASQFFADVDFSIRKAANEHPNRPIVNIVMSGNLVDYASLEGKEMSKSWN